MTRVPSGRLLPGEFAPYAQSDIDAVVGTDAVTILEDLAVDTRQLLRSLRDDQAIGLRYAPNKCYPATPRGLAFHIAGHELHHLRIVRERYLSLLVSDASTA